MGLSFWAEKDDENPKKQTNKQTNKQKKKVHSSRENKDRYETGGVCMDISSELLCFLYFRVRERESNVK